MSIETFETLSLPLGIGLLVAFMGFIIWDLAKSSGAGKFGTVVMFIVLGLGLLGFVIKTFLVELVVK